MTSPRRHSVLDALLEGNARFVAGAPELPRCGADRRLEVSAGQHPFAAVVACSDSRVSPEIVFNQGLGDLFVVRSAGNVVDEVGLASLEYAVAHLGVSLIAVLGHSRCGAVTAAARGGEPEGHLGAILSALSDAVAGAGSRGGDPVEEAARRNVTLTVKALAASEPVLAPRAREGKLLVAGLFYDVTHGTVEIIA